MRSLKTLLVSAAILGAISANAAFAATSLFMTSPVPSLSVGDTVTVEVRSGSDAVINAAQGTIRYPTDVLSVDSVSDANSIFNIWVSPPSVNTSTGAISFLGGSTNAFSGAALPVFSITFRARGAGAAAIQFQNAAVTAGDGTGANILSGSTPLSLTVLTPGAVAAATTTAAAPPPPKQITRPAVPAAQLPIAPVLFVGLYPDPTGWYSTVSNFLVQWKLPSDVSAVATAVNQNPEFDPAVSEGLFDNKIFGEVEEGIWYLHVRFKNSAGWGPTAHYRIAIDEMPPNPFMVSIKEGTTTEIAAPTLQFSTQDQPSGVAFYRILADGVVVGTTTNTMFTLSSLAFGSHAIIVEAVDYAGNMTQSRLSIDIAQPPFLVIGGIRITQPIFFGTIIAVLVIGFLAGMFFWKKREEKLALRVAFTESETSKIFDLIEEDIDKLSEAHQTPPTADDEYALSRLRENVKKMEVYLKRGIEKINK